MSTEVHPIDDEQTMLMAHRLMRQRKVRLLPVMHQENLVGVVSDRDLNLIDTLSSADPRVVKVAEAMMVDVLVVGPNTPLEEVVTTMAQRGYHAALVREGQRVVGMLTAADACAALVMLMGAGPSS
jgi:CBS domain-containing protein